MPVPRPRGRRDVAGLAPLLLLLPLLGLAVPLAALLAAAQGPAGPTSLAQAAILRSTAWTLGLGLGVGLGAAALAYPVARAVPVPLLVGAVMVTPLARALGVLGLGLAPGPLAAALALAAGAVPLAALVVRLRLQARPVRWLEAAADLGASAWARAWWIERPYLWPAAITAAAWVALQVLGDVTVLRTAGGGKVYGPALMARDALLRDGAPGRALLVVLVLLAVALAVAARLAHDLRALPAAAGRALGRGLGRAHGPFPTLGGALGWALGWALWLACLLPLLGLVPAIVAVPADPRGIERLLALVPSTLTLAVGVSVVAVPVAFGLVLALRRREAVASGSRGRGGLARASLGPTLVLLLPLAVPPSVLGSLWLGAATRLGLQPGELLTAAAFVPAALALAYLAAFLLLRAVPGSLPAAAADLGAGPWGRLRLLWWPAARAALGVTALLTLAWIVGEPSIPAFTAGPGGSTLAMGLQVLGHGGDVGTLHRGCLVLALVPLGLGAALVLRRASA
jgi:ABC-type Fe3+ transport system permease subunit